MSATTCPNTAAMKTHATELPSAGAADPTVPAAAGSQSRRLLLLASIVIAFLAASSAPTPLYEHYDEIWHGTALSTTIAFGIYAGAVLAALLSLGRLADHIGRNQVVLAALAGQAIAVVLFATAGSFTPLLVGRIVQGLATGAALGSLGAAMIETDRGPGTIASAAAPGAGTGLGALIAGLVVAYLPWPTHAIYVLLLIVFFAQAVAVTRLPQPGPRRGGALASLRPQIAVPVAARATFASAAPVLFAVWALAGFYGSLGPALSRQLADSNSVALGGVGLFILAGVASVTTILLRNVSGDRTMAIGIATLIVGIAGTITAIEIGTITGYFLATAVAGIGFGAGFQGGIRTVTPLAVPAQRTGLLSAVFLVSYVGMGAPAVIAGYLVSRGDSLTSVAAGYGAVLLVLAAAAALGLVRRGRPRSRSTI
jgi:MFS family permease